MPFVLAILAGLLFGGIACADEVPAQPTAPERRPVIPGEGRATTLVKEFYSADKSQRVQDVCYDDNIPEDKNEMPTSNPVNVHCSAALYVLKSGKWVFSGDIDLGQGEVKRFANFQLTVRTVDYDLSKDAMCCPSVKNTVVYDTGGGKLVLNNAATAKYHKKQKRRPDMVD